VYPKDHVAGMVMDGGIRMSGAIIEELHDGFHGCLGTFGLLGGDGAQCSEKGAVHSSGIIQEYAHNLLNLFGVGSIKNWGSAGEVGELYFGSVLGFLPGMWGMFGFCGWWMTQLQKCMFDVAGHREIDGAVNAVPGYGDTTVAHGCPVLADLVVLL